VRAAADELRRNHVSSGRTDRAGARPVSFVSADGPGRPIFSDLIDTTIVAAAPIGGIVLPTIFHA
jgi:hypothetical protein